VEREHETRGQNKDFAVGTARPALLSQNTAHAVRVIDNETAKTEQQ